jgi:hypothetical protein
MRRVRAPFLVVLFVLMASGLATPSDAQPGGSKWGRPKTPAEPPPPPPIEAKRVSEVGGARWSSMVGFVASEAPPASDGAAAAGNLFVPAVTVTEGN